MNLRIFNNCHGMAGQGLVGKGAVCHDQIPAATSRWLLVFVAESQGAEGSVGVSIGLSRPKSHSFNSGWAFVTESNGVVRLAAACLGPQRHNPNSHYSGLGFCCLKSNQKPINQ